MQIFEHTYILSRWISDVFLLLCLRWNLCLPTPTSDDEDEFDVSVDLELFSYPLLPSIDSTQDTQDTQSEEIGYEFILVEEAMRAAPASIPAPATAHGHSRHVW